MSESSKKATKFLSGVFRVCHLQQILLGDIRNDASSELRLKAVFQQPDHHNASTGAVGKLHPAALHILQNVASNEGDPFPWKRVLQRVDKMATVFVRCQLHDAFLRRLKDQFQAR